MKVKEEAAALGACVVASVQLGYYKDYDEAVRRMVKVENRIQPNAEAVDVYRKAYLKYKEIYTLLEPSWIR
jgi:sugar (pentulose or hexulose) kinase